MRAVAEELGIEGLLNRELIERIYDQTGGHPYVMRVVIGEMAKEAKYTPPTQVLGKRSDIVDAVFERSFNKLSDAGRSVFLTVANWKSDVPDLGLLVVLGTRGVEVQEGIDECRRLSLIFCNEMAGGLTCYSTPHLARAFAHKKLQGDPDRLVIQEDLVTLQKFGTTSKSTLHETTQEQLIESFVGSCFREIGRSQQAIQRADRLLEALANLWSSGWLRLADFREQASADREAIAYALRRAVEEEPFSKQAWLRRAEYATKCLDKAVRVASLVSAVEADPTDLLLLREAAGDLCYYVNEHKSEIPATRRGVYLASVRSHMERVADSLDPTGLSRLAWLFLLEGNVPKAREYANRGCAHDPTNVHCLKILERLDRQPGADKDGLG